MRRLPPILTACLALVAFGLAIVAWRQRSEIQRLGQVVDRLSAGPALAAGGRPVGPALTRTRTHALSRPARDRDPGQADRETDFFPSASPAVSPVRRASGLSRLMADPDFVRSFSLHQQGALDARFAALFRRLNLSAEELAAFKRLLVEKENVALDVVAISQEAPDGPMPAGELRASITVAQSQVESAILASLGSERYALYQEFERTLAQRAMVARLEQRLSYTATPLQPAQAESLVRILGRTAAESPPATRPAVAVLMNNGAPEGTPIVQGGVGAAHVGEDVIAQSQEVLTPPQIAALRQLQLEMNAAAQAARIFNTLLPPGSEGEQLLPGFHLLMQ